MDVARGRRAGQTPSAGLTSSAPPTRPRTQPIPPLMYCLFSSETLCTTSATRFGLSGRLCEFGFTTCRDVWGRGRASGTYSSWAVGLPGKICRQVIEISCKVTAAFTSIFKGRSRPRTPSHCVAWSRDRWSLRAPSPNSRRLRPFSPLLDAKHVTLTCLEPRRQQPLVRELGKCGYCAMGLCYPTTISHIPLTVWRTWRQKQVPFIVIACGT